MSENPDCPLCNPEIQLPEHSYREGEILQHTYIEHNLTKGELSELFDCGKRTVATWISRNDIEKRKYTTYIPEDKLRELYNDRKWTTTEIADYFDCGRSTVGSRMDEYGIEADSDAKYQALRNTPGSTEYRNEGTLRELYWEEGLSQIEIGERFGVHRKTVDHWFQKHGIEKRSSGEALTQLALNEDVPYRDEEVLRELYWDEGLTQKEIGKTFGVKQPRIQKWMKFHGIENRNYGLGPVSYETEKGEVVRSSGERTICNWLHDRDIDYTYEPDTDFDLRPDFLVDGDFVEYWGMVGMEEYEERMAKKLKRYDELGVEVVGIYPEDINSLEYNLFEYC